MSEAPKAKKKERTRRNRRTVRAEHEGKTYVLSLLPDGGLEFHWLRKHRRVRVKPAEVLKLIVRIQNGQPELF